MVAGAGYSLGNAYGRIVIDASGVSTAIQQARNDLSTGLQSIGGTLTGLGASLTTVFTPISIALGKATSDFLNFNEAMTNIQAVTGVSDSQIQQLSADLLTIGENSRYGPQQVAAAFYTIAGGVTDASVRMAVLQAAVAAAEAGNADLGTTTNALIAIMNGYGLSADQASMASDVLTQTVNLGVGSMNDFATALPLVTGLAHSLNIPLSDVGAAMAYLTTKGTTASEAGTQLTAMMRALLVPSPDMVTALHNIGFESGQAAINQLGLVGTFQALADSGADLPGITGRVEGLRGAIALTDGGFQTFSTHFSDGLDGITQRTQALQDASPAAQLDLFNSTMQALSITIGATLVPALNSLLAQVIPIIQQIMDWIQQNPQLTGQILLVVGALGVLGPVLIAVGMAITAIGAILGFILSPIGLLIAGIVALAAAWQTNFMGIRDTVQPILDNISTFITTTLIPTLQQFVDWFNTTGLPFIQTAVNNFITNVWTPATTALSQIWQLVQPALQLLADWFTTSALPFINTALSGFLTNFLQPVINVLSGIWNIVSAGLTIFAAWFTTNGIPFINTALTTLGTIINGIVTILTTIWTIVSPYVTAFKNGIQAAFDWIRTNVVQPLVDDVNALITAIQSLGNGLGAYQGAGQNAQAVADLVTSGQVTPGQVVSAAITAIGQQIGIGGGDYQGIHPAGAYLVGTGAQPQLFMPQQDMYGIPNIDQYMQQLAGGGGGGVHIDNVHVYADSYEGGQAAGRGFADELESRWRGRGN